jgi:hypothetical protein
MYIAIHKALFQNSITGRDLWYTCLVNNHGNGPFWNGKYDIDFVHNPVPTKAAAIALGISILTRRGLEAGIMVRLPNWGAEAFDVTGRRINPTTMKISTDGRTL